MRASWIRLVVWFKVDGTENDGQYELVRNIEETHIYHGG
jgi:hypothetical protein